MASAARGGILARLIPCLAALSALVLLLAPAAPAAAASASLLEPRCQAWPQWTLPAPLERPGRRDLHYPDWFAGSWEVLSSDGSSYQVHFLRDGRGRVVGDRAGNAAAVGAALLNDQLRSVSDDPRNPNRQLARLAGPGGSMVELESTVVGRRTETLTTELFLADELSLQVVHGAGEPAVSRVETLSRFERLDPDHITAQQWQARYPSPALGLSARAERGEQLTLSLVRAEPEPDRAS
ncbi:MAG: DUF6816 family protein [Prochlorococcaceae cyanobacterium]